MGIRLSVRVTPQGVERGLREACLLTKTVKKPQLGPERALLPGEPFESHSFIRYGNNFAKHLVLGFNSATFAVALMTTGVIKTYRNGTEAILPCGPVFDNGIINHKRY